MYKSNILAYLVISALILPIVSISHNAFGDLITCVPSVRCLGTTDDDTIKGTKVGDAIRGGGGNDKVLGNAGGDEIVTEQDNDKIQGGDGDDYIETRGGDDQIDGGAGNDLILGDDEDGDAGGYGSDVIFGGRGNDELFHSQYIESHGGDPTGSDGHTDKLDCGPGNDEAWINVGTDHDVVKNCEVVHTEND